MDRTLLPFADQWCVFGAGGAVFGTGCHWLGRLAAAAGDIASARAHLERAVELSETARADYWAEVARAQLDAISWP